MTLKLNQKGLIFAILAPLCYALQSVAVKFAPPAKLELFAFFKILFNFLLLTPFFIKYRKKLRSQQLLLHFMRAVLASISLYCSVYGIRHLALVDAILLECTLSLFIPVIAWIWYGKKITVYSCLILLMGFTALFILLKPKLDILHLASFASLVTAITAAIQTVSITQLSKTEHFLALLFYCNLFAGVLTVVPFIYTWENTPLAFSPFVWLSFVSISFFGVLFQYTVTRAYSLIPVHVAGNFAYLTILFSALFGWLIWRESLNAMQIFGGVLLIGSGLLMVWENQRTALLASKEE